MSNLLTRVLVALVGIPCFLWVAFDKGISLWIFVGVLQIVMLFEWKQLLHKREIEISFSQTLLLLSAVYAGIFYQSFPFLLGFALLLLALWLVSFVCFQCSNLFAAMGGEILYIVYIALPLFLWTLFGSLEPLERFTDVGALVLLFVATWFCDSGAYFVGKALGRHKLFERASPNKTVEGAVGGFLFSAFPLPIAGFFGLCSPSLLDIIVLPIAVGVFGQIGDLLESLFKREAGVKDSSNIIPGHGGLLDRFDSLLLSTPVFFAYLVIFP